MIKIVQGVPGSGKSYFAVYYLCTKFAKYDNIYQEWILNPGVLLISNLEGLKCKHLSLEKLLERWPVEEFFTVANFEKIQAQYKCSNIVLIIDEAQRYFDYEYYNKDVFYFFQYHRHLGVDVFLMTQDVKTLAKPIPVLCEYIITAAERTLSIMNTFRYKYTNLKGKYFDSKVLRKRQDIFSAYKSFTVDEIEKPKNAITKHLVTLVVIIFVVIFGFKASLAVIRGQGTKNLAQQQKLMGKKPEIQQTQSIQPLQPPKDWKPASITNFNDVQHKALPPVTPVKKSESRAIVKPSSKNMVIESFAQNGDILYVKYEGEEVYREYRGCVIDSGKVKCEGLLQG